MKLPSQQAIRFNQRYNQLLQYTAKQNDINEELFDPEGNAIASDTLEEVEDILWDGSGLIDSFVEENPYSLNKHDLETVGNWRYGIIGSVAVVGHENDGSILMTADHLFKVVGVDHDLSTIAPETPLIAEMVLLPFEGTIICRTTAEDIWPPDDPETIMEDYATYNEEAAIATTADDLIRISQEYGTTWDDPRIAAIDEFFANLMFDSDDLSDNGDREENVTAFRELTNMVEEHLMQTQTQEQQDPKQYIDMLLEEAFHQEPQHSLAKLLALSPKDRLLDIARNFGFKNYSKLKKQELADLIAKEYTETDDLVYSLLAHCDNLIYKVFLDLLKQGGTHTVAFAEAVTSEIPLVSHLPFIYLFSHQKKFTLLIADEFVEMAKTLDLKGIISAREQVKTARHFVESYTLLRGIVGIHDLYDLYHNCCPDGFAYEEFLMEAVYNISMENCEYTLWSPYDSDLAWDEDFPHLDPSDLYFIQGVLAEGLTDDVEEQFADDPDYRELAEEADMFLASIKLSLLEHHQEIPLRIIPADEIMDFDFYELLFTSPATVIFMAFLSDHMPESVPDERKKHVIGHIVEELFRISQFPLEIDQLIDYLDRYGYFLDDDEGDQACELLEIMLDHLPSWIHGGFTPAELADKPADSKNKKPLHNSKPQKNSRDDHSSRVFKFKVELDFVEPYCWREIIVASECSFLDFHIILQNAFNWHDYHLWDFTLTTQGEQIRITEDIMDDDSPFSFNDGNEVGPSAICLSDVFPRTKKAHYLYDYGDSWEHSIRLIETIDNYHEDAPVCTDGAGDAPPEDVGGGWGFEDFLNAIADPSNPEHDEMVEWGEGQSFERFNRDNINIRLANWQLHKKLHRPSKP